MKIKELLKDSGTFLGSAAGVAVVVHSVVNVFGSTEISLFDSRLSAVDEIKGAELLEGEAKTSPMVVAEVSKDKSQTTKESPLPRQSKKLSATIAPATYKQDQLPPALTLPTSTSILAPNAVSSGSGSAQGSTWTQSSGGTSSSGTNATSGGSGSSSGASSGGSSGGTRPSSGGSSGRESHESHNENHGDGEDD